MSKPSLLFLLLCLSSFSPLVAQLETIVTGLDVPNDVSVYNDALYITQLFGDELSRFDPDDPAATLETVLDIDGAFATHVLGNDIYLGTGVGLDAGIYRLSLLDANPTPILLADISSASGLVIKDSILYVTSDVELSVSSLDLRVEGAALETVASNLGGPSGIVAIGTDLYVTEFSLGQVAKIDLTDNSVTDYLTGLDRPNGITAKDGLLYIAENNRVFSVDPSEPEPSQTLVVDGLDQSRGIAFRGAELYIVQAIGVIGTGRVSRFILPIDLPGDSCQIAVGVDSLLGGAIGDAQLSRVFNNEEYSPNGEQVGTDCFSDNGSLEHTLWFRFTGDGGIYEVRTTTEGTSVPLDDTQIA
ncbi:MAG: hypothetical protein AAF597_08260 [Bacteroidota bacterium]